MPQILHWDIFILKKLLTCKSSLTAPLYLTWQRWSHTNTISDLKTHRESHTRTEHKQTHARAHAHIQTRLPCSVQSKGESKSQNEVPHPSIFSCWSLGSEQAESLPPWARQHPGPRWGWKCPDGTGQWPAPVQAQPLGSNLEDRAKPWEPRQVQARAGGSKAVCSFWSPPAEDLLGAPFPFIRCHTSAPIYISLSVDWVALRAWCKAQYQRYSSC